jgi:hypothetical protein
VVTALDAATAGDASAGQDECAAGGQGDDERGVVVRRRAGAGAVRGAGVVEEA